MNKFTVVKKQNLQEMDLKEPKQVKWAATKKDEYCESVEPSSINDPILASSSSSSKSSSPPFSSSSLSSSSSDLADDASSFSSNSSPPSCGPLYELADLMAQLPIKRGLSKFYHGKSQSFASLLNVKSVEDLAKKEMSCRRRMKSCKSYGGILSHQKFGPKAAIGKRTPKTLLFSPPFGTKGVTLIDS